MRFEPDPESAPQPGSDQPLQGLVSEGGHAADLNRVGPLGQQLAPPFVVTTRGAGKNQRPGAIRMEHPDDLRDDAAHRGPMTCARSMRSASRTAIASSAIRSSEYGSGAGPVRPTPRLSIVMHR